MMFDLWPVYSGERFMASGPSCLSSFNFENRVSVAKICSFFLYLQIMHLSTFGFNQSSPSGDMMKTRYCQHLLTSHSLENEVKVTRA